MQSGNTDTTCIIAGAGISGLLAARSLEQAGIPVIVLEEARVVGGRLSTSRIEDGVFDDGAQFFTVRDPRFASLVAAWQTEDVVTEWSRGFARPDGSNNQDGHPRYVGMGGMAAIPAHLAHGLDVRTGTRVAAVQQSGARWYVTSDTGTTVSGDALLLTPPAEQSLALVNAGGYALPSVTRAALEHIEYTRCIAVLALLDGASGVPEPGGVQYSGQNGEGEPVWWLADNRRKGASPQASAITIHAGPCFSREHWDRTDDEVGAALLETVNHFVDSRVRVVRTRRWRYSQPVEARAEPCLVAAETPPLVFAGDAFGGAKVEGAALSGLAAAEQIRSLLL
ncbi:MAG: FAD-dependent oxidoreductase [Chloroflexota bacterium]|nr:FAD-dependent oxidoreductase [Chloroflexota bacterium]